MTIPRDLRLSTVAECSLDTFHADVMDMPVAANVLGTMGAICWSVQLIPQIVINYRRHDTTGLQPTMMLLWATAGVPLGVYNIVEDFNVALQIQPQILTFLSLLTWVQCKYYRGTDVPKSRWSVQRCVVIVTLVGIFMGGIEVALVFALRIAYDRDVDWPAKFMGALSGFLLCAGVARHYWDIYKTRTVRGISFLFVGIDALGDLTSLISVFFQPKLDILGMIIYGSELALWLGVFACGGYYNFIPWLKARIERHRSERNTPNNEAASQIQDSNEQDSSRRSSDASSTVFRTASISTSHEHPASYQGQGENEIRLRQVGQV